HWGVVVSAPTRNSTVGTVLVKSQRTGLYDIATSAARSGGKRSDGIARSAGDSTNRAVQMQVTGPVPPEITGLGAGIASWVRVSTTGTLQRCIPATGDDLVGWAEADGTLHANFGFLTDTIATAASGGFDVHDLGICTLEDFGAVG